MIKYAIGEKIIFNNKDYYIAEIVIYDKIEYYFVFDCDSGKKYKILYEEDEIIHQIVKYDKYIKVFEKFKEKTKI